MSDMQHRRRVGTVRPSHLMFTGGVGALIDLPNFPVLVRGLDDWNYDALPEWEPLIEPRLLAAVGKLLNAPVRQLRPPPWMADTDGDPTGQASRVGVPVIPFPQWLRCTACNRLAPMDSSSTWGFVNDKPRRPDEAKFFHQDCPRRKRQPLAVAARFVLACVNGHLDDFPYREFVHRGGACPEASHPALQMDDYGGNRGANVVIRCTRCPAKRNISQAMGRRGEESLPDVPRPAPAPRARSGRATERPLAIVVGASNTWFAQTLVHARRAGDRGERAAGQGRPTVGIPAARARPTRSSMRSGCCRSSRSCTGGARTRSSTPSSSTRKEAEAGGGGKKEYPDLLTPEWDIFTSSPPPDPTDDFALRRDRGVPAGRRRVPVGRRAGRAAPRGPRADRVHPAGRARPARTPTWSSALRWRATSRPGCPRARCAERASSCASTSPSLSAWESQVADSRVVREHGAAFGRFRTNRYSERIKGDFDADVRLAGRPVHRAAHAVHLLIRTIALECGYSSASLSERIYSGPEPGRHPHLHRRAGRRRHPRRARVAGRARAADQDHGARPAGRAALLLRPAVRGAAADGTRRLPARRRLPRVPVRLRDHLRARQPVPRPPVRRPDRRQVPRAHPVTWDEHWRRPVPTCCARAARPRCEPWSSTPAKAGPGRRSCGPTPYAAALLDALADVDRSAGLAYLTGLAAGYAQRAAEVSVEIVWSGPGSHHVPVRATAAVLADVVRRGRGELLLMTYSARQYQPLTVALQAAVSRGVQVSVVVETLQGAGSALAGDEPYQAFTGVGGIDLWHWPSAKRTEPGAKMHAKLAVADRRVLFVTSANLTQSGVGKNIEAGLLVRGGAAPARAAEHVDALRASGSLVRLA